MVTSKSTPSTEEQPIYSQNQHQHQSTSPAIPDNNTTDYGYYEQEEMDESLQHSLFDNMSMNRDRDRDRDNSPNRKNRKRVNDDQFESDSDEDGKNIINNIEPTVTITDEEEHHIINPKHSQSHSGSGSGTKSRPKLHRINSSNNSLDIVVPNTMGLQDSVSQTTPKAKELAPKFQESPNLRPKTASSVKSPRFFGSQLSNRSCTGHSDCFCF